MRTIADTITGVYLMAESDDIRFIRFDRYMRSLTVR